MIKVLITGGSGFIGTHLTDMLRQQGHHVEHIGRSRNARAGVKTWLWDVSRQWIEPGAFNLDGFKGFHIVHLAGEGIVDKPWTPARKKSIVSSRVDTITFLYNECVKRNVFPLSVVSASGISYYGAITSNHIFTETDPPAHDFLGECCIQWEKAARLFENHCPVAHLRTSLVLDRSEGALPMMDRKILGIRPIVGSGDQWTPWVHIHDLCRAYVFALSNRLNEAYNVAAPTQINYRGMLKVLHVADGKKHLPFIGMKVPLAIVKMLYGNRHILVTEGSRVSGQKLVDSGFTFDFPGIEQALADIYR